MSLTVGSRHGPYDVLAPLGSGDHGPIFRARDTTRDHDVVIEVLPEAVASDSAWLARVQRIAATLAGVDHPNIAKSYGLGSALEPLVLVTQVIEGPSLADVIESRGTAGDTAVQVDALPRLGLDPPAAFSIAFQIASALEAAHGHDVVHGGLRPRSIAIPADGVLKVRGFGLDLLTPRGKADDLGALAARGIDVVAYASPEQLKGRPADRQSDIWAFGVLLYEMLSGVRPFIGEDTAETMAVVLRADAEWSALPIGTPRAIRDLLRRCLHREPNSRLDDITVARQCLEERLNRHVEADRPVIETPVVASGIAAPPPLHEPGPDGAGAPGDTDALARPGTVEQVPFEDIPKSDLVGEAPDVAAVVEAVEIEDVVRVDPADAALPGRVEPELSPVDDDVPVSEPPLFGSYAAVPAPRRPRRRRRARVTSDSRSRGLVIVALLVGVAGAGLGLWTVRARSPVAPTSRYVLSAPPSVPLAVAEDTGQDLAIAPDGTLVAYATNGGGRRHVYVRHVDELEGRVLADAPAPETLFFSPDGGWIGFADGQHAWQKVSVGGGPSVELTEQRGPARGASWSPDGIVFAEAGTGLFRVPAVGGLRRMLTSPDRDAGETGHYWPTVLPGGRALLFTVVRGEDESRSSIAALDLESKAITRLVPNGHHPQFVTSGHLVYSAGGSIYAIRFDPARLAVAGHPVPVVSNVITKRGGIADFQVSPNGTLVYAPGRLRGRRRRLTWVGADGTEEPLPAEPRSYESVRIAPDGRRVAVEIREPESEIWIWDVDRARLSPLLSAPAGESNPTWTPDGTRIAFQSDRSPRGLFWTAADGGGAVESLQASDMTALPFAWSPDGQRLVYGAGAVATAGDSSLDLGMATMTTMGTMTGTAGGGGTEPLLATEFDERNADISPDGRWIVLESAESGRPEIYVRPFPDVQAGSTQVSIDGGRQPVWSPDGTSVFFLSPTGTMMVVDLVLGSEVEVSDPRILFEGQFAIGSGRSFDIAPDGDRFLVIKDAPSVPEPRYDVVIVEGWAQELDARVP